MLALFITSLFCSASAADASPLTDRPVSVLLDAGLGAPTGLSGGRLGLNLSDRWGVEAGGGLGGLGIKTTTHARYSTPAGPQGRGNWTVSFGPTFAFYGEDLGFVVPDRATDSLMWSLWADVDAGWTWRARSGFTFRVDLGVSVNIADNQTGLCRGTEAGACYPGHALVGARAASVPFLPYFGYAIGWSF